MLPPVVAESHRDVAVAVVLCSEVEVLPYVGDCRPRCSIRIGWDAYFPVLSFADGALRSVSIWTGHFPLVDFWSLRSGGMDSELPSCEM